MYLFYQDKLHRRGIRITAQIEFGASLQDDNDIWKECPADTQQGDLYIDGEFIAQSPAVQAR